MGNSEQVANGGEVAELDIADVAFGGDGVGRLDGEAVFVPFAVDGERVRARITARKKSFARAEIVEVVSPSPHRVDPPCRWFGRCGGCQYQHVAYGRQLELKRAQLSHLLRRIGQLDPLPAIAAMSPAPLPYAYRNKIVLHGREKPGFVAVDNRTVLPIDACPISAGAINVKLASLAAAPLPSAETVLRCNAHGRCWAFPASRPPAATIEEVVLGRPLRVPLRSFFQVNPPVLRQVLDRLIARVTSISPRVLIDAYAGAGVMGLALAGHVEQVIGIERDGAAVRAARFNAEAWGQANCRFLQGAVQSCLPRALHEAAEASHTALLLDPPRSGLDTRIIEALKANPPATLLYVSCNPPVLARDLARLAGAGYVVQEVAPFDMFPQAAPFEVVAELRSR